MKVHLILALSELLLLPSNGQNVVEIGDTSRTVETIKLTMEQARELIDRVPAPFPAEPSPEAARVAAKLDRHVTDLLDSYPFLPFHHTLGISGYECYFDHPDELFHSVSIAIPHLPKDSATRVREFLTERLSELPPYSVESYGLGGGTPRESYIVPDKIRHNRRTAGRGAFGVYALWAYVHFAGDREAAREHWPAATERMKVILENVYPFDIGRTDHVDDEAEILNGDLAGLIGYVRLARMNGDAAAEERGLRSARDLFERRVNLERVNPSIMENTRSASRSLHILKLARYCGLVPEIGEAVRKYSDGCGEERLRTFREARNGWHIAFGDRFIGGENYTNPPHFVRALFSGAALIEQLPADELLRFIDVPWCRGDLYFIEKCALALRAAGEGSRE